MKTVVFDIRCSQPVGKVKFHGGGEYVKTVFRSFVQNYDQTYRLITCFDTNSFIDEDILEIIKLKKVEVCHVNNYSDIINMLEKLSVQNEVRFFSGMPYVYNGLEFPTEITTIGTCHGLRAIEKQSDRYLFKYFSGLLLYKEYLKKILKKQLYRKYERQYEDVIKKFDVLITDSKHSEYSIKLNYPEAVRGKKITVCYPMTQAYTPFNEEKKDCYEKYIMLISADRWLKNSYRAIMAIDGLYNKGLLKNVKTKIYGNLPNNIRQKITCIENFEFFAYVSSEELELAYKNCEVFCYPTLNEGFGNVPMEAMKYGKTCIISGVCSLTEVYGDAVYYFNPYDIMEIQNRILQAMDNKIDTNKICKRIEMLQKRQEKDMNLICKLIKGEKDE